MLCLPHSSPSERTALGLLGRGAGSLNRVLSNWEAPGPQPDASSSALQPGPQSGRRTGQAGEAHEPPPPSACLATGRGGGQAPHRTGWAPLSWGCPCPQGVWGLLSRIVVLKSGPGPGSEQLGVPSCLWEPGIPGSVTPPSRTRGAPEGFSDHA